MKSPLVAALLAAFAATTPARADPETEHDLGDGYRLVIMRDGLAVVKGGDSALLVPKADGIVKVAIDRAKHTVAVDVADYTCIGKHSSSWAFAQLDARLANLAAYAQHLKKNYKVAAVGFAKAAALDPAWRIAAYNLASADTLLGDKDGAIAALAPWLAAEPIATYVQISADPELRPLLERPEVRALRAAAAGKAELATDRIPGGLAISADKKLVAVVHLESSWGSSAHGRDLEIIELATGKLVATSPIHTWDESSFECNDEAKGCEFKPGVKQVIAKRVERLRTMLDELGFEKIATEIAEDQTGADPKSKLVFPQAKLGIAALDGTARVLQGNTTLATKAVRHKVETGIFIPELRTFVVWTRDSTPEGCDGYPERVATVIRLNP